MSERVLTRYRRLPNTLVHCAINLGTSAFIAQFVSLLHWTNTQIALIHPIPKYRCGIFYLTQCDTTRKINFCNSQIRRNLTCATDLAIAISSPLIAKEHRICYKLQRICDGRIRRYVSDNCATIFGYCYFVKDLR